MPTRGDARLAPDLGVEIMSPNDRLGERLARVGERLEAGTSLVRAIEPERRAAYVYCADGTLTLVGEASALEGEGAPPGWRCTLDERLR